MFLGPKAAQTSQPGQLRRTHTRPAARIRYWLLLVLGLTPLNSLGYERAAEQRLAAQLKPLVQDGTALELGEPNDPVFAIYNASRQAKTRGGLIIIPDLGEHADWPEVVAPLRTELPQDGWACLSLQLPLVTTLPNAKNYEELLVEAAKRIRLALDYLKKIGNYNILLLGHGIGAHAAMRFLTSENGKNSGVGGFIAISMYPLLGADTDHTQRFFDYKDMPVLDVYGSLDLEKVMAALTFRGRLAKKAGKKHYQRLQLTGAEHSYRGFETTLIKRIRSWLDRYAPSFEITTPERVNKSTN